MNEKLIKTLVTVVASFIILLVVIFGISSCLNKKRTFGELEDKMLEIAKTYYEEKKENMPKLDNKKTISLSDMIELGKIKSADKFINDENVSCKGNVTVYNNNGNFIYTPYLDCGKDYKTIRLKDKIIKDNLTTSGVGLYEQNGKYIMKGEVKNNYLMFNNILFRIMRINSDDSIRVIQLEASNNKYWDNRYNFETKYNSGLNEYIYNDLNSRIKDSIEEYYKNETIWPKSAKAYIKTQDLCIGKRTKDETSKDGSVECKKTLKNQQFGLLSAYEYLQASLDANCLKTTSTACSNYNWYTSIKNAWTQTALADSSSEVFELNRTLKANTANSFSGINIVVDLVGDVVYSTGTGSKEDPYILK